MVTYTKLSRAEKITLINSLRVQRINLLIEARKRKKQTKRTIRKKKQLKFASPTLEALFNSLGKDAKKYIAGR